MERKGQLICAACGAPRSEAPGVEVLAPAQAKGKAIAYRALGFMMVAAAVLIGLGNVLADQYTLAAVCTALFGGSAWLNFRQAKLASEAKELELERAQLRLVRELMADQAGRVTADQAARKLGVKVEVADALLTRAAKDGNFEVDFDEDGTVYYIDPAFSTRGARVRIDASSPDLDLEEDASEEQLSTSR